MRLFKIFIHFIAIIALSLNLLNYGFANEPEKKPEAKEAKAETSEQQTIMEIKPLDAEKSLFSVELRDVEITDLLRMLAQNYKLNIWIDKDVKGKVTASFNNISLEEAIEAIVKSSNLAFKKEGNIIKVIPDLITKTFRLLHIEAGKLIKGDSAAKSAGGSAVEATVFDLLSDKGKILLGEQPNSIMVIDYPQNIQNIEEYIKAADQGKAQRVFKLKYLSVSELFPELAEQEREIRKKQRDEIEQEREALGKVGVLEVGD